MVLYPNKLPESERVCSGICNNKDKNYLHNPVENGGKAVKKERKENENYCLHYSKKALIIPLSKQSKKLSIKISSDL